MNDESATGLPLEHGPVADVLLSGRYRLGDVLGSGPAGHVYAADDVLLKRAVAVKVLDGLPDPVSEGRAVRAARAAARAWSPRLVEVLDVERERPSFLVLAPVRGQPLAAFPHSEPLPPARALALLDDVLDALAGLHAVGAVHRDVTPSNVWLGEDGRAWLTSAGMAEAACDAGLGLRFGDDEYRRSLDAPSPEQALGLAADTRSDVYAVGVLAQQLLAGGARPAVAQVLRRATAEDPGERHPDAAELRAALASARHGPDPVVPSSVPAPVPMDPEPLFDDRQPPPAQRRPTQPRVPWGRGLLGRILLSACVAVAAWLLVGVPLTSPGVERGVDENPLALFGPVGGGGTAAPSPAPAAPAPAPPAQLPADGLAAVLDAAATSPVDLGPETAALLTRLGALDRLRGVAREAEAADLYGRAALDATAGTSSAPVAAQVAELLRPELTIEGVVALVDRDPAAAGPGGRVFATRLRLLAPLEGEQRRGEAVLLAPAVDAGRADGTLSPPFAAAAGALLEGLAQPG